MYTPGFPPPTYQNQPPHGSQKRKLKLAPVLLVCALVVAAIAAVVTITKQNNAKKAEYEKQQALFQEVNAYQNVYLPNIYVDGIHIGGMTPQEAIDTVINNVRQRQNSWNVSITYQGHTFVTINYDTLGVHTDEQVVYDLLRGAFELGHREDANQSKLDIDYLKENPYQIYTTQSSINTTQLDQILEQITAHFTYAPTDAKLVYFYPQSWEEPFGIQKESYGSSLDSSSVRRQVLDMASKGESGSIELQPQLIPPKVTESDVRKDVTLIGECITPIDPSSTTARTDNIRVAFSRYHGKEILPGETVSFNKIVGPRTMENGFQMAIEYANGLSVPGWGGGVCQASTTIYKAALTANLDIVSRTSHSDKVTYTEFGQDATVYYTSGRKIDFSFKNNTNGKIYIMARVEQTGKNKYQCVVRIYGHTLGDGVEYKLRTQTVETLIAPLMPEYQEDKNHEFVTYKDEEPHLVRKARDGFINETYLQRWENGVLVSEEMISRDTCKARAALYYTGTKNR